MTITTTAAPNGGYTTSLPTFTVTFSEAVTGYDVVNVGRNLTGVTSGLFTPVSATTYTLAVYGANSGAITLSVPASVATDAASNGNTAATPYTVYYNVPTAAPVVATPANNSLTMGQPTYAGTAPAGSTVTLYLASGTGAAQPIATTTATGGSFNLTPTMALTDGSYSVYATAQSSGQAVSANSNTNTFTVDATPPTATISTTASSPTSTAPILFSVSEVV